jgi:transcription antitermination factor NusG
VFDPLNCKIGDHAGFARISRPRPLLLSGPLFWHIVRTHPHRAHLVVKEMEGLALKPYLPVQHRSIAAGRRRKREIEEPLLGDRIFVQLPLSAEAFCLVRELRDVDDFVMMMGDLKPALVPDRVIEIIREVEAIKDRKWRKQLAKKEESPYHRGRQVWADIMTRRLLGTIEGLDARGRIEVSLETEIFGRRSWPIEPHLVRFVDV